MDQMLTDLIRELFECYSGPLPRLAYVADFTGRLKNSGMRWSHEGAKTILTLLTLRTILTKQELGGNLLIIDESCRSCRFATLSRMSVQYLKKRCIIIAPQRLHPASSGTRHLNPET